jgi:hypothetical protein
MVEAILSSEMSVLKRATRHHIPEDGIIHSHSREHLKSYICTDCLDLERVGASTSHNPVGLNGLVHR